MNDLLKEDRFSFIADQDKGFILAFSNEMSRQGMSDHMDLFTEFYPKKRA